MKMALQILTSLLLAYWPIVAMTSVMAFDAPGSTDNRSAILFALGLMFSPLLLGILYFVFNQTFWGMAPKKFLLLCFFVPLVASVLFGYPQLLLNSFRGVSSNNYFVKGANLYFEGDKFEGDANSFEVIDQMDAYARDRNQVYYRGKVIEAADPSSFTKLEFGNSFYKDRNRVYFHGKQIPNSDSGSFTEIKKDNAASSFYKDKYSVYWIDKVIDGIDVQSVELIGGGYIKDSKAVFYFNKKLNSADPASFAVFADQDSWAKDKSQVYFRENAFANLDPKTTEILQRAYVKDKDHVYYLSENKLNLVESAQAKSFRVTNWDESTKSEATDSIHYFLEGKETK